MIAMIYKQVSGDQFTLFAALCPGGYEVVYSPRVMCRCKESVSQVLNCEDDQDSIIIQVDPYTSSYS